MLAKFWVVGDTVMECHGLSEILTKGQVGQSRPGGQKSWHSAGP